MKKTRLARCLALSSLCAACLPPGVAYSSGFQVLEHSAAGLGRAFAGEAVQTDDASVVAGNPAAMSRIKRRTVTVAGTYVNPNIDVEGTYTHSPATGGDSGPAIQKDVAPEVFVPASYFVLPTSSRWTFGAGVFTNFGLPTDYDEQSNVVELADKTDLVSVNFNPSVAYAFSDNFSVGAGLDVVYGKVDMTSTGGPTISGGMVNPGDNILSYSGSDWGLGWNIGALWQVNPATRLGLSYRSRVHLNLRGQASSSNFVFQDMWTDSASMGLTLPNIVELALHHQLTQTVALYASAIRTGWHSFKTVEIKIDGLSDQGAAGAVLQPPVIEQGWHNSMRYALGASWEYSPRWRFSTGLMHDDTPTRDETRRLRIPDTDRVLATVGARYQFSDHHSIDFGYGYAWGTSKGAIDETLTGPEQLPIDINTFKGSSSGNSHLASLQYNYRF